MSVGTSSKGKEILGLPIDVVLTSVVALLIISTVILGDIGIAGQVRPGAQGQQGGTQDNTKWTLTAVDLYSHDGYTSEKTSSEVKAGEAPENTTVIEAKLTWTDDYGSNDVFKIELQLEGKGLGTGQGSTGEITVETNGTSGQNLTGNITVLVTCVSSPGLVGPNPFHVVDKGNSWTLNVKATVRVKG
jgi:hypothetical protein